MNFDNVAQTIDGAPESHTGQSPLIGGRPPSKPPRRPSDCQNGSNGGFVPNVEPANRSNASVFTMKKRNFLVFIGVAFLGGVLLMSLILGIFWRFDYSSKKNTIDSQEKKIESQAKDLERWTKRSCPAPLMNKEINGYDIDFYSVSNLSECCTRCHHHPLCRAYVMTIFQSQNNTAGCWLKSATGPVTKNKGNMYTSYLGFKRSDYPISPVDANTTLEDVFERLDFHSNQLETEASRNLTSKIQEELSQDFLLAASQQTLNSDGPNRAKICQVLTIKLITKFGGGWMCFTGENFESIYSFERPEVAYRMFTLDFETEKYVFVQVLKV